MIKRHFGTDGIRGKVNIDITPELAMKVGQAFAYYLRESGFKEGKVIVGQDTRESGDMLRNAFCSGVNSLGLDTEYVGVVTTPAIPCLIVEVHGIAGAIISASHNPYEDNGIKLFNNYGRKLSNKAEETLEDLLENLSFIIQKRKKIGRVGRCIASNPINIYKNFILSSFPQNEKFQNYKIVLDPANGAGYQVAKDIFEEMGADVIMINNKPDGRNINHHCGSTDTKMLKKAVTDNKADLGLALDGDGDRIIAVDEDGKIVNGDKIVAILASQVPKDTPVVITKLGSIAVEKYLQSQGYVVQRSDVGDKNVFEKMEECGSILGGEESGHIIYKENSPIGDGIFAGLKLLEVVMESGKTLAEIANKIPDAFQIQINLELTDPKQKDEFRTNHRIISFIDKMKDKLHEDEQVVVRESGTQELIRIMAEGSDKKRAFDLAYMISNFIKREIEEKPSDF